MSGWTYHGGRLADAKRCFDLPDEAWVDLSTGINPGAWPDAANMAVDWQSLPDIRALEELEKAAAAYFAVDRAYVCTVPGTEIGLRLIGSIMPGPAAHVAPSYRTHAEMFAPTRPIEASELPVLSDETVILANPNNPDGSVTPRALLLAQLARSQATSRWLVIDEAFADADPSISMADYVADANPLVIFRSFGKFFGLAGVRLGFVIGPQRIIASYRERLGSWPVSAAALSIGLAAYRDLDWITATRQKLHSAADALDIVLRKHGHEPIGDCPLFRLIEVDDAPALFERLARRAILTRPFDYNPRWLRIGLPADAQALARLDAVLTDG
jgi:cobalamin biosynthetic protein CobC